MKTYEKFIISNLYTRRRKLDPKIIELGDVLTNFIKSILKEKWQITTDIWYPNDKKNPPILTFFAYPYDLGSTINFIQLYGTNTDKVHIVLFKNKAEDLDKILIFLEQVLSFLPQQNLSPLQQTFIPTPSLKLPLDKLDDVIKELTLENFDLYINANKYNL